MAYFLCLNVFPRFREEALKEAAEMAEATKIADTERQKQEEQRRQIQVM